MRVRFGGIWIADSEQVFLLFEPGRYPVAYFPETDISSHALERTDHPSSTPISGSRPGMRSERATTSHHEGRGRTPACRPTRANCRAELRSSGRPWTHSTKKTNGSWAMRLIATTASTFAKHPATWWLVITTASSPIPRVRSSFTSLASRRAGTFNAPTSMSRPHSCETPDFLSIQRDLQLLHHR